MERPWPVFACVALPTEFSINAGHCTTCTPTTTTTTVQRGRSHRPVNILLDSSNALGCTPLYCTLLLFLLLLRRRRCRLYNSSLYEYWFAAYPRPSRMHHGLRPPLHFHHTPTAYSSPAFFSSDVCSIFP